MNEKIVEQHRQMVYRLEKPGADILKTLTPEDCSLLHVGGCLMGEASELHTAILMGSSEIQEELGDAEFYLVANFRHWGMERREIDSFMKDLEPFQRTERLMVIAGDYWDVIKRAVIYRKAVNVPDSKYNGETLQQVAERILREVEVHIAHLEHEQGFTIEEVLDANYEKLAGVDKGRYKDGYSDQQAQDRRDKQAVGYDESVNQHITAKRHF